MASAIGFLCAICTLVFVLAFTVERFSSLSMFIDVPSLFGILIVVYGLSVMTYGRRNTVRSLTHLKYLFKNVESAELLEGKPSKHNGTQLSQVYISQIVYSLFSCFFFSLTTLAFFLSNLDEYWCDPKSIGPWIALMLSWFIIPMLLSGTVYYPLSKKLNGL